jgi:serine/threonine protein kinase
MPDYTDLQPIDPSHYVVDREIARGGMGRIMSARDRRLGRQVAIKELFTSSADLRARFEREARITARLQHSAIVNVLEAGAWPGGEPFYVMRGS